MWAFFLFSRRRRAFWWVVFVRSGPGIVTGGPGVRLDIHPVGGPQVAHSGFLRGRAVALVAEVRQVPGPVQVFAARAGFQDSGGDVGGIIRRVCVRLARRGAAPRRPRVAASDSRAGRAHARRPRHGHRARLHRGVSREVTRVNEAFSWRTLVPFAVARATYKFFFATSRFLWLATDSPPSPPSSSASASGSEESDEGSGASAKSASSSKRRGSRLST